MNDSWRDVNNPEKNPNALAYGISSSAPASISPIDIEKWKGNIAPTLRNYFTEEYNDLVRQYETLVKKYNINKMIYESHVGFEPVIGHIYYLYQKTNGQRFLSLVPPETTFWNYVGSYRLTAQYAWEDMQKIVDANEKLVEESKDAKD